ncbi:hypothetical protein QCA50_018986 [Cerrena zonata]|uniref:3'-5' exonuclease domain-containing protein n=1 Tax=Cerrena zonata TaxID=2478898 RepID=A0AAW0FA30_9APHY
MSEPEVEVEKTAVETSDNPQEKTEPKEIFNAPYTYVETYNQLADAVLILSRSPYLAVDCEGYDIAQPDGKLSLLTIGTAEARDLFVIDVLNIKDKEEASVVDFVALLTNEAIPKIMWDGRGDFVEISDWYGIEMQGILDLQIAEITARTLRHETESIRFKRFVHSLHYDWDTVHNNPNLFSDIHILRGLDGVVRYHKLGENLAKDTEVVTMHKAGESGRWMERPLPDRLIQYAANDVYLIATVYTYFTERGWIQEELKEQTSRYVNTEKTREHKQRRQEIGAARFLPLGVLSDPSASGDPLYVCSWCERLLDIISFQHYTVVQRTSGKRGKKKSKKSRQGSATTRSLRRKPCCRVCVVSAMKSEVSINDEWITIET